MREDNRRRVNDYERMKRQSLHGEPVKRTRNRRRKMSLGKKLVRVGVMTGIAVSMTLGMVNITQDVISDVSTRFELRQMMSDFQAEVINPNTHRTDDFEHYWYDYVRIANAVEDLEDDSRMGVYFCLGNMGEFQANRVMEHTNYKSLDGYFEAHNYKDSEDFMKKYREEFSLSSEIDVKKEELRRMQAEHEQIFKDGMLVEGYGEK